MRNTIIKKNFNLGNINLLLKWFKNPLIKNKNKKKINIEKVVKKIEKLVKLKDIKFLTVDNIRIGLVANINKKKIYYINPFSYSHLYLNENDLKNFKIINRGKKFLYYRRLYKQKDLEEIKLKKNNKEYKKNIKKILILGPKKRNLKIIKFLYSKKYKVVSINEKINLNFLIKKNIEYIISSGYPHKIDKKIVKFFNSKIINLHATFLPWGKGIGTTFISFLLFQPVGISIHHINSEYDKGNIICRYSIKPKNNDTTRTFYGRLLEKLEEIFIKNHKSIIEKNLKSINQNNFLSRPAYYSRDEFENIISTLPLGYDTKLVDLVNLGFILKNNKLFLEALQ
jgi:folate-dependent phosphoribosylglycinamide formyltransferase PurN